MAKSLFRTRSNSGLQRSLFAAAIFTIGMQAAKPVDAGGKMDEIQARSRLLLPVTLELEGRAAIAIEGKSVADLKGVYEGIRARSDEAQKHIEAGGNACGCDVALTNLLIAVGFAINKLDGQGRFEPWMDDESLDLLDKFDSFATDCANDAEVQPATRRLTAKHLKAE